MKSILNKLRSRAGASMILAMVFMLFCSFIGGTVLASATANAQRVAQMAEQQDFLLERSAALLVSDQLQLDDGDQLRLNVIDSLKTINEVTITGGGVVTPTGESEVQRVIAFQVSTNTTMTSMHRLMMEATVWRYLRENAAGESYSVVFQNFPGGSDDLNDFLFQYTMPGAESSEYGIEGTMHVSASVSGSSGVSIPDYTAGFSCGRGSNLYDFFVDFGEDSQVMMTVNGYSGTSTPITVVAPASEGFLTGDDDPTGYIQVTSVATQTTIAWEDPMIEKGGAA